jgi:hypothetical protein
MQGNGFCVDAMAEDFIRYDILAQDALRGVIRKVLDEVARSGLPGDHHFFVTYETTYPGVRLSQRMLERYPEEITIVIQHTFWNLDVGDNAFEIDLSFDDIRERLRVPFAAIKGFFDPSVKFGLQFDVAPVEQAAEPVAAQEDEEQKSGQRRPAAVPAIGKPAKASTKLASKGGAKSAGAPEGKGGETQKPGAEVVSLDTFRKRK